MTNQGESNPLGVSEEDRATRTLLNALPVGVVIARDPDCHTLELNATAAEMFGVGGEPTGRTFSPDQLPVRLVYKGKAISSGKLLKAVATRSATTPSTTTPSAGSPTATSPTAQPVEVDLIDHDGRVKHVLHFASPMNDEQGVARGYMGLFVATDSLRAEHPLARQARERFAGTLDTMPDPFGVFTAVRDNAGRIIDFTIQYMNVAGLDSNRFGRDEQIGRRLLEIVPELTEMGVFGAYADVVETGTPLDRGFIHRTSDDTPPDCFEIWATKLGDGVVARWRQATSQSAIDATLRESEARLRQLNETLEARVRERTAEANARTEQLRDLALDLAESESRERKRFAQLLHDHFQQLVSAAKLRAGIIRRKSETPELRDSIQQIEQLLVQAIDASRTLATQLSPPVLHDAGLVPAIESIVRGTERDNGLSISFEGDPLAEPVNERIRLILFECARELIQNVVQHSFSKTARVEVSVGGTASTTAKPGAPSTTAIRIAVRDQGRGFDLGQAKLVHNEDKPFGLLRIQERIRYIGGDVRIDSKVGQGSLIEVIVPAELRRTPEKLALPRSTSPSEPMISGTGLAYLSTSRTAGGKALRIVVADDHRLFRDGLTSLLAHEPYLQVVGEAADGDQAINLARQLKPDVLICDISMPKRNGVEVTATLSRELPQMRIIGLSMHEREDMANAMRAAGASAYLTKSGPSDLLLGILRTFVMPASAQA